MAFFYGLSQVFSRYLKELDVKFTNTIMSFTGFIILIILSAIFEGNTFQTIKNISLGLISTDGKFKRISINEISDISNRSTTILKLKDSVKLKSCILCKENSYLYIVSDIGRIIKLKITENDFPFMGKLAQGTNIIKLKIIE